MIIIIFVISLMDGHNYYVNMTNDLFIDQYI